MPSAGKFVAAKFAQMATGRALTGRDPSSHLAGRDAGQTRRLGIRARLALLLAVATAAVCTACQVDVGVTTKVNEDGSGAVTVAAGFDDKALARLGNPENAISVDDMKAAGLQFSPPSREADGLTWYRATKPFSTLEEGTETLRQLTGPAGPFRDFSMRKESSIGKTAWSYSGTVDLTKGLDGFGDPTLAPVLNGDMFGGNIAAVEQAEGRPVRDMFKLRMDVELPGGTHKDWSPSFTDPAPTHLQAESSQSAPVALLPADGGSLVILAVVVVGLGIAAGSLLAARRYFRYR